MKLLNFKKITLATALLVGGLVSGNILADDNPLGTTLTTTLGGVSPYTNEGTISGIIYGINTNTDSGAVINNSGTIAVTGDNNHGIAANGDNPTITNSGLITTSGGWSVGIVVWFRDGGVVTNSSSGIINVSGNTSLGVSLQNPNSSLMNYGLITSIGSDSNAVLTAAQNISIFNAGTLESSGSLADAIYINPNNTVTITNTGSITAERYGVNNLGSITTLNNSGTISSGDNGIGIYNFGTINTLNNSGAIFAGANGFGIDNLGTIQNLTNSGTISVGDSGYGIHFAGVIPSLNNSGTISAGADGTGITNLIFSEITLLTNSGFISVGDGGIGLENLTGALISTLTNFGTISAGTNGTGILNLGTIDTLNNAQGGIGASPLGYSFDLPTNYNIIINSASHYGQLAQQANGSPPITDFGIYGAPLITSRTYTDVLSGTIRPTGTSSGVYDNMVWNLVERGSSFDLVFFGVSKIGTQLSLNALASKLRGVFASQTAVTNFANMNTYDCNLFDEKGMCISVGGQQTYVDSPSANMTSAVVVAGYKVSPTLRVGGFLNQNVNSNTGSNVDISNNSPLMGLFAVWNQNENHLGYQVKIANAYQDMDVTTTRDVIGTSEAGRGKTDLNTQSYVGELSYAFLTNEDKTLVRPYAAVRYTRIKQDGYTERTTSDVTAPLTYASLSDRSTAALVGVKLNHKLTDKVNLTGSLGVEQDLNHDVDNLTASGVSGLTSEAFNNNINRTRPVASIGAYYMPVKNQRIAADVYYQELPFQSTAATTAYVNYMIGF